MCGADVLWLQELLGNLLGNALLYTPAGGVVTIRCGVLAQQHAAKPAVGKIPLPSRPQRMMQTNTVYRALLEVEDNGPGIPPSDRSRVMERLLRMPGIKVEGTGLGLAIAREIAIRHRSELVLSDGLPHETGLDVACAPPCCLRPICSWRSRRRTLLHATSEAA